MAMWGELFNEGYGDEVIEWLREYGEGDEAGGQGQDEQDEAASAFRQQGDGITVAHGDSHLGAVVAIDC